MSNYWWIPVVLWIVGHGVAVVGHLVEEGLERIEASRGSYDLFDDIA